MFKKVKTLQEAIICLALSLAILLGVPGESWVDASFLRTDTSAYISYISELIIDSATSLEFNYDTPEDDIIGNVYIWDSLVPTATEEPKEQYLLSGSKGKFEKNDIPLNLL